MKVEILKYLNSILEETDIRELSIKRVNNKIIIHRNPALKKIKKVSISKAEPPKKRVEKISKKSEENLYTIKSMTVGIFYRGKSKDDKTSLIKVGDEIKKNDLLGVIDCMGVMEKVTSPVSGKVKEILIENEKPVEYGHPLFIIEVK